jgi:hypothetical protein
VRAPMLPAKACDPRCVAAQGHKGEPANRYTDQDARPYHQGALDLRTGSQQLKEKLGLDHFEGRSWQGLHRHVLMTMIAYAFLQHHRLGIAKRGKRVDTPPPHRHSQACQRYVAPSSLT